MNDTKSKKAAFIDRDGTLVEEVNFLSRIEDLRLFPFTVEALKLLKRNDFTIVVITNQSGIGRKLFTESDMRLVHAEIQKQTGNLIDAFYFCPHLPTENCRCRKPQTEMIERAARDFAIDLETSWMIGDKKLDIETGFNAKVKTAMVLTGYGKTAVKDLERKPELIAENLLAAAESITNYELKNHLRHS